MFFNDADSIVDQDDDDHVVLASIPNHSFLSPQALQGDILDNDDNKEDDNDDNDNNDDDGHLQQQSTQSIPRKSGKIMVYTCSYICTARTS